MAFMSGLWNSIVGGNEKEVTWEEISQFYFDKGKKYFSVSERDKQETPIVYGEAHKITFNKTALGFTPLNFVSIYNIDTRKGLSEPSLILSPSLVDTPFITVNMFLIISARSLRIDCICPICY